jgi:hypothetical protein
MDLIYAGKQEINNYITRRGSEAVRGQMVSAATGALASAVKPWSWMIFWSSTMMVNTR